MPDLAYLNGAFLPLADAKVSVEDRGFQFGDGVYEVIRTYRGRPFELAAHLRRLDTSAQAIHLTMPESLVRLTGLVEEGIRRAEFPETKIYIQVSRGVSPRDHAFPVGCVATLVMTFREMRPLDQALRDKGVAVMTTDELRWARCDVKSVNLLGNVLAKQRALEAGAFEALFIRDGVVTEGAVSNVMAVRRGELYTAPVGPTILAGVTRQVVLDLAQKEGVPVHEEALTLAQLQSAEEVFLTGTTMEVLPVVRLNANPVGKGIPGPVTLLLARRFQEAIGP